MLVSLVATAIMLVLLVGGGWVFAGLGIGGCVGLLLSRAELPANVGREAWLVANNFVLIAIPLYIFMGEILLRCGISEEFYDGIASWLDPIPGGLLHANVVACAFFAAISGSSVATTATIGTLALPELEKRNYSRRLSLGSITAGGSLGILIPPSINMIVYAAWTGVSVGGLFMAGVIPGVIVALLFMGYIFVMSVVKPELGPRRKTNWAKRIRGMKELVPLILLITLVLGGIYTGVMTPTEAAAVGSIVAMIVALVKRRLSSKVILDAALHSVQTTSFMMIILVGAMILAYAYTYTGMLIAVPQMVIDLHLANYQLFGLLIVAYLIMGCFVDGISLMVLTLPFLIPILNSAGMDLLWFGVIMIILIEESFLTPPVGINLYVMLGIAKGSTIEEVVASCVPFFLIFIFSMIVFYLVPDLVMLLPNSMMK